MPERVAAHRIIFGQGADRKTIEAGSRFRTEDCGLDAAALKAWEDRGVVRRVRDDTGRAPVIAGPPEPGPIVAAEPQKDPPVEEVDEEVEKEAARASKRGARRSDDSIDNL